MDIILQGAFLFLVLMLLLPLAFSHTQYFSVLVWMSWTMLNFPHVVFTFTSTSRVPSGILQNRYLSRLQATFRDLLYAILKLKFSSMCVVCDSNAGDLCIGVCYSHSHSRLYQDFLCFNMMYMCIRSLLPNNFLTFSLWMSGIQSVVGKCISLSFKIMWMFSHLICNTSHIQFFFRMTFSNNSSPDNLNKCVFLTSWFRSNEMYDFVSAKNSFIFTTLGKGCPQKNMLFLIFCSNSNATMMRFRIIRIFNNPELQFWTCLSVLRVFHSSNSLQRYGGH